MYLLSRPTRRLSLGISGPLFALLATSALAATVTVNDAGDSTNACATTGSGTCTLRDALTYANAHGGTTIAFGISGAGVHTITPGSADPMITAAVTIDGFTQPGSSPNTNGPGLGAPYLPTVTFDPASTMPGPTLPSAIVPVTSVPIRLPSMVEPFALSRLMPPFALAEITLPAPAAEPPIVLASPNRPIPKDGFPRGRVPVTSVPMKLPSTTLFVTSAAPIPLLMPTPPPLPEITLRPPFANWIEQLSAEAITGGCGGGNYCPGNPNTRGQMAVFTKTFNLP